MKSETFCVQYRMVHPIGAQAVVPMSVRHKRAPYVRVRTWLLLQTALQTARPLGYVVLYKPFLVYLLFTLFLQQVCSICYSIAFCSDSHNPTSDAPSYTDFGCQWFYEVCTFVAVNSWSPVINAAMPSIKGLSNNPTCEKCGTEEETSVWVWGIGLTQTCITGYLPFGPWEYYEPKYGGHLKRW